MYLITSPGSWWLKKKTTQKLSTHSLQILVVAKDGKPWGLCTRDNFLHIPTRERWFYSLCQHNGALPSPHFNPSGIVFSIQYAYKLDSLNVAEQYVRNLQHLHLTDNKLSPINAKTQDSTGLQESLPSMWQRYAGSKQTFVWTSYRFHLVLAASLEIREWPVKQKQRRKIIYDQINRTNRHCTVSWKQKIIEMLS